MPGKTSKSKWKRAWSTYVDTIGRSRLNLEGDWPWAPSWKVQSQRNGLGPPPARAQMIEYLISRTMGNQRRHTASLLAVQSLSRSVHVCLSRPRGSCLFKVAWISFFRVAHGYNNLDASSTRP